MSPALYSGDAKGTLGTWLRAERVRRGLNVRDAAVEAGVPFTTLSRIERGWVPTVQTLGRLVVWLDLGPSRTHRLVIELSTNDGKPA